MNCDKLNKAIALTNKTVNALFLRYFIALFKNHYGIKFAGKVGLEPPPFKPCKGSLDVL